MRPIVIVTAVAVLLGCAPAFAQSGSSGTGTGTAAGSGGVTAPVGHRQPKRSDVPDVSSDQSKIDAADRELDRKIKGICRGC